MIGPVFEIPYANALTLGEFDASTSFDSNATPASHVAYSLLTLGAFQAPGQTRRPDVLKWPDVPAVGVPEPECGYLELDCYLSKFFGSAIFKDYMKRTGLVLLAVILIVVAIVSLR